MAISTLSQVAQETQESSAYSPLYTTHSRCLHRVADFGHMGHLGQEAPNCVRHGDLRVSQGAAGGPVCWVTLRGHLVERIDLQTIGQTRRLRRTGDRSRPFERR